MNESEKHNFLKQVAFATYHHYKGNLDDVTFVFPNRRSGLFFQRYLGEVIGQPIFSPEIVTITELFEALARLTPAEPLSLLLQLYKFYLKHTGSDETFDTFMFWGQMLLTDFDDICKYDVDARMLFANLRDIKVLDASFDYLSEEQKQIIRTFWDNFDDRRFDSVARGKFKDIWIHLADIMQELNQELLQKKEGYQGLTQLEAVKRLESGIIDEEIDGKKMVFVGFNALTGCEHRLFSYYQKRAKSLFFWDYSGPFLSDKQNIASKFKQENLRDFPQEIQWEHPSSIAKYSLIGVPSLVGQAQYVRKALKDECKCENDHWIETAVVLPDENLLMPVLQALPEQVCRVNVTMGYPLASTEVMGFLELLCDVRRKRRLVRKAPAYYHKTVVALLRHKYMSGTAGAQTEEVCKTIVRENRVYVPQDLLLQNNHALLLAVFKGEESTSDLAYITHVWDTLRACVSEQEELQEEKMYIHQACVVCERLSDLLKEYPHVQVERETLFSILRQYMRSVSIPFKGEPLDGLQVMGLLETRALDFKNVVILSANEGTLPRTQNNNSFIPYNLRKGYGLPTFEEHDAIMAYNFYRLISNAEQVHLVYDNRIGKEQTNEMSRYVWQLKYQYNISLKEQVVTPSVKMTEGQKFTLNDSVFIQERLDTYCQPTREGGRALSASALNTFFKCSARFYFAHLCGLSPSDEVKEEIEADMFGTLYHGVMEALYMPYKGKEVTGVDVTEMKHRIKDVLVKTYAAHVLKMSTGEVPHEIEGNHSLILRVIEEYVEKQLDNDLKDTPFTYVAPEQRFEHSCAIEGGKRHVNLVGYVDRIDQKADELRIIDYKTGKVDALQFSEVSDLFDSTLGKKRPEYALQTMLYAWFYMHQCDTAPHMRVVPYIASLRSFYSEEPLKGLKRVNGKQISPLEDYRPLDEEFEQALRDFLEQSIFAPNVKFTQVEDVKECEYCPFVELCGR